MNIRADMKPIFSDKILASGDVYLDEKIVIHNVKVIQADKDGKTYSFVSVAQMKVEKEPLDLTVEVRLYEKDETRGYATVNYGGLVKIDGVRIFERDGELRVSYPYEKNGDRYQNIAGPVSPGIRKAMTEMIVKAYQDKKLEQEKDIGDVSEEAPVPDGRSL